MDKHKRKPLPTGDGVAFIETLERAVVEGDADFVSANMPKLKRFVKMYMDRVHLRTRLHQLQKRRRRSSGPK